AIEKAAAIARSIIAIQTGIAQAAATPFPGNLAAIASVIAATGGIVSTIQSTSIQGQAHAGMDRVPTTGTYLLERGERVVTAETSAKLDRTLDDVRGGGAGSININNYLGEQEFASMMASRPGEQVMNNYLRKNQRLVQQLSRGV
ncbi:MAG: phage tail tape measure protein, partial [Pseudomonadota bacterium]